MKLIILNGSSCAGKSSIIKHLLNKKEDLFYLHYDAIKWFFSKYSNKKHYKDIQKIYTAIAREIFNMEYNIISDSSILKKDRENLISLAKQNNYEIVEINLEVDFDILLKRFDERVKNALKIPEKNRKISNVSKERFKEIFDTYNKEKNSEAIVFRTDQESSEEIAEKINNYLEL